MKHKISIFCSFLLILILTCCKSIGPSAMRAGRMEYNKALAHSASEQLLLNIVKMRFFDQPVFLSVSSLTSNISFQTELGSNTTGVFDSTKFPTSISPTFTWKENPTITYEELRGADYIRQMLAPIPADTIVLVLQSWPADMVLPLTVNEINNVNNVWNPLSQKINDSAIESSAKFSAIATAMNNLGMQRTLEWSVTRHANTAAGTLETAILLNNPANSKTDSLIDTFISDLNLTKAKDGTTRFTVEYGLEWKDDATIVLGTRSMQDILSFASLDVDIPINLTAKALKTSSGWHDREGERLFHVHVATSKPSDTSVVIPYRDHWFYIKDDDMQSKATFLLMQVLMGMQSGASSSGAPVLTIPVSG